MRPDRSRLEAARERLRTYLKARGLRSTRQRDAILEAFIRDGTHASAEDLLARVQERFPSVGQATIYRAMNLFVDAGIANQRRFHEGCIRFEPGLDAGHHDHLVCLRCGRIEEFEDPAIEELQRQVARTHGFRVHYHRMELYGLCRACREDADAGSP